MPAPCEPPVATRPSSGCPATARVRSKLRRRRSARRRKTLSTRGAPSVDVVGYSAGGVVARLWVADGDGAGTARRVVTLGSPQHGIDVAGLAAVLAPGSCPAACQELTPDSPLLGRLNRGDETPAGPLWVSIWTTDDQVVTPATSASLDGRAQPCGAGRLSRASSRPWRAAHRPGGAGAGAGRAHDRGAIRSASCPA